MNRLLLIAFVTAAIISLWSCGREVCEGQVKSLDSLSGALNQKLTEFKQVDTAILGRALNKFDNYKQFIRQNVNDTVSKAEADILQQFYGSGNKILAFSRSRKDIIARGELINSQIGKLLQDANNNALEKEKFSQYYNSEKGSADQLIKASVSQQQEFQASLQEFKLSLSGIETLIRSRNSGQMPTIIKDSVSL